MNEQDQELTRIIAQEAIKDLLSFLPDEQIQQLADRTAPYMWANMPIPALKKIKRGAPLRVTIDGSDINDDINSNPVGHEGPTLPDIVDFVEATGWLTTGDGREAHIRMRGGGAMDCVPDILISECWATEVAAGRGTEGQQFTSLSGCIFYVVSTAQYAWDGVGDLLVANGGPGGAKDWTDDCLIFVCPGSAGPLSQTSNAADTSYTIWVGADAVKSYFLSTTSPSAGAYEASGITKDQYFFNLGFRLNTANRKPFEISGSTANGWQFTDCLIAGTFADEESGRAPVLSLTAAATYSFNRCGFKINQGGGRLGYSLDAADCTGDLVLRDCYFRNTINYANDTHIFGGHIDLGNGDYAINNSANTQANTNLDVEGLLIEGEGTYTAYFLLVNGADFQITNCIAGPYASSAAIILSTTYANNGNRNHVVANKWKCDLGIDNQSTQAADECFITYTGNDHAGTEGGSAGSVRPIIAQGKFTNSTFAGNGPAGAYYNITLDTMCMINGVQVFTGAPSHSASESMLYFDTTANTMYINTSSGTGTTWSVLGVSGGGAAAPSPHNLVSVHHDGEQDYTNDLYLANLRIGAGDIDIFSDAGSTQTAEWDSTTGHIAVGTTVNTVRGIYVAKSLASATARGVHSELTFTTAALGGSFAASVFAGIANAAASGTQSAMVGVLGSGTHEGAANIGEFSGLYYAIGSTAGGTGTITNAYGIHLPAFTWSGAVPSTIYGLGLGDIGGTGATVYPIYVPTQTGTAIHSVHVPAMRIGSVTPPTNVTAGDLTATRLIVPDATLAATGTIIQSGGPITMTEAAAPGTPSADAISIYNETNSDALKMMDDTGAAWRLSHKHVVTCVVDGTTTTQITVVGPMPHAGTIVGVYSKTCDNITIGATDWKGDVGLIAAADAATNGVGTSIFSGTLPTIADMYQAYGAPNTTAFAAGDYFAFSTNQAGSSATMVTMTLDVRYT